MSADNLSEQSRDFYENAKLKTFYSVMLATLFLFCLAMTSCTSADAEFAKLGQEVADKGNQDSKFEDAWQSYISSSGFQATMWSFAMVMTFGFSIYFSPLIMGSPNEKSTLKDPVEITADVRGSFVSSGSEPAFK